MLVLGQIVTPTGFAVHNDGLGQPCDVAITEPLDYRRHQRADLPVYMNHDETWRLGRIEHLERSQRHGLMCAASLNVDISDLLADGPWYFSDRISSYRPGGSLRREDIELREVSLVRATANCNVRPVAWSTDERATRTMPCMFDDPWERAVKAIDARRYRRAADTLDIVDLNELSIFDEWRTDRDTARTRLRSARTAADAERQAKLRTVRTTTLDGQRVFRHTYPGKGLRWVSGDA